MFVSLPFIAYHTELDEPIDARQRTIGQFVSASAVRVFYADQNTAIIFNRQPFEISSQL